MLISWIGLRHPPNNHHGNWKPPDASNNVKRQLKRHAPADDQDTTNHHRHECIDNQKCDCCNRANKFSGSQFHGCDLAPSAEKWNA